MSSFLNIGGTYPVCLSPTTPTSNASRFQPQLKRERNTSLSRIIRETPLLFKLRGCPNLSWMGFGPTSDEGVFSASPNMVFSFQRLWQINYHGKLQIRKSTRQYADHKNDLGNFSSHVYELAYFNSAPYCSFQVISTSRCTKTARRLFPFELLARRFIRLSAHGPDRRPPIPWSSSCHCVLA